MTEVTANPAEMQNFVTGMGTAKAALSESRTTEAATVRAFLNEGSTGITGGYEIVGSAMTALIDEYEEIKEWVRVVRQAAIDADVGSSGDYTVSEEALNVALNQIAANEGINLDELAASTIVTPPVTSLTPTPQDSGFVNDPVCTATGHLLIDATDFVMPARLSVLSFRRQYASQDMVNGAFGPGWWTWADARGGINAAGDFELVGPDARHATFAADGGGGFDTPVHLDLVATIDGDTQRLRWGRRSPYFGQTWVFAEGLLREVVGPFVGSTTFHYASGPRLVRLVHDSGREVELAWRGRVVGELRANDGRVAAFRYDRRGHLVEVANAISPETYDVDEQGRVLSITDADGVRMVAMTYDADGRVIAQISQTGLTTRFGYASGMRTTLSDASHSPISVYTHDEQGRVEMYATAGGLRFSRRFDEFGRVVEQHEPDGTSVTMAELTEGGRRVEQFTSSTGQVERFEFDHLDRLVRHTADQGATTAESTRFEYHGDTLYPSRLAVDGELGLAVDLAWENGLPSRIADSDGVVDEFEVGAEGTIAAFRNALGDVTRFEYAAAGALSARYLPDGRVVAYERDDAGRLLAMVNPAGERGELAYTPAGRLLATRDYDGAEVALQYDEAGLPARVVAPDGAATEFVFDDEQRVVGVQFANGDTIGFERDEFGRETAVDVGGSKWEIDRDQAGRVVKVTDPDGVAAEAEHDPLGQWMSITDSTGERWQLERGLIDRVRRLRTPTGVEEATYTAEGLLASTSSSDGKQQDIRYTAAGRIASIAEGGQWIEYRYDDAGRMTGVNSGTGWWHFEHDANGRMVRRVSPAGREQRYGYDVRGHAASITVGDDTWSFEHDARGRLRTLTDPTGRSSTFTYDQRGRMLAASDAGGVALRYAYDGRGRVAQLLDAAGGAVSYTYNSFHQLTSITDQLGRSVNAEYDKSGRHRRTTYVDPRPDRPSLPQLDEFGADLPADLEALVAGGDGIVRRSETPDGLVTTWTLVSGATVEMERDADGFAAVLTSPGFLRRWVRDDCGRILAVTDEVDGTVHVTTLDRDGAGRIVRQEIDGEVTEFAYGPAGELIARSGAGGDVRWEYDRLGRMSRETTPDVVREFHYDAAHQLVELTETPIGGEPLVTTFEYDGRGRRVRASGARDVAYVWGDRTLDALVVDGDVRRYRSDAAGRLEVAGGTAVRWDEHSGTYQPSAIGDDAIITVDATTAGRVDGAGQVTWRPFTVADAWGTQSGAGARWHEFYGIEADGLVWLGSRPYDPATRQFLAPDPLSPKPGKAGSASPYTYAANDPINLFDPSGNAPISIEAFNDMRDRKTGPQWQNIAVIAIAAVAVVATIATAGAFGPVGTILVGTAIGALSGAASGAAREGLEAGLHLGDGEFNGETIIKDTLMGAAGGAFGAGVGVGFSAVARGATATMPGLTRVMTSRGGSIVEEAIGGFGEGVMGEGYDVTAPQSWGADGTWDNDAIVTSTVTSAGLGGALHNVRLPGQGGSPTDGADPSTTGIDSPAPDRSSVPDGSSNNGAGDSDAGDTSNADTSNADTDSNSDSGSDSRSNSDTDSQSNADTDSQSNSDTDPQSNADTDPQSNADTDTQSNSDTDTQSNSDTDTQSNSDTDSQSNADTDSQSNADTDTQSNSDADTQSNADTDTQSNADTDTQSNTDTDSQSNSDTDTQSNSDSDTDSQSNSDTDSQSDSDTDTQSNTDTDTQSNSDSDTDSQSDSDTDSQSNSDTDTQSNSDTDTQSNSDTDTQSNSDTDTQSNSDTDTQSNSDSDTDTQSDSDTDTQSNSDTDTDTQSDSDTDSQSNSDTDTQSDSDTDSQSNSDTDSQSDSDTDSQSNSDTDSQSDSDTDTDSQSDSDTDTAEAAAAAAAAASVNSPSGDTPGSGSPPSPPGSSDASAGGTPPNTKRFVVVRMPKPVATRTVNGKKQINYWRTVDVNDLTPVGGGKATLPDGTTVKVEGNEMTVTYDSNGVPMRFRARITEQYPNISKARQTSEKNAQGATARDGDTGITEDKAPNQSYDGGHAGGHQFFPGLGRDNMFPQESGFNQQVYTQLEAEIAAWANTPGVTVDMEVDLKVTRHGGVEPTQSYDVNGTTVQQVPDRVTVRIRYTDADGNTIRSVRIRFRNDANQSYKSKPPTAEELAQLSGN